MEISGKVVKKSAKNWWVFLREKSRGVKKIIQFIWYIWVIPQFLQKKLHKFCTQKVFFSSLLWYSFPCFPHSSIITTNLNKKRGLT